MNKLSGKRVSADIIKDHHYVCDLIFVDGPILSLFSDGRRNWLYLWCDTNSSGKDRWIIFPASREVLVAYFEGSKSLRTLVLEAARWFVLDRRTDLSKDVQRATRRELRQYLIQVAIDQLTDYLPANDSLFDPSLTADLNLEEQLSSSVYSVPIGGTWFGKDFQYLFKVYERLYAFFYATRPRFVRTVRSRLERLLRAPWMGGYSRVNLYSLLAQEVPGLHSLRIAKLRFASPGEVEFDALSTVGISIRNATLHLIQNEEAVDEQVKVIKRVLTAARYNRLDASEFADSMLTLTQEQRLFLESASTNICDMLAIHQELKTLKSCSPNLVVYCKAVNSFVWQLKRLSVLQREGMLDFEY